MRDAGLIVFRRDDVDIVGQRLCDALERSRPGEWMPSSLVIRDAHGFVNYFTASILSSPPI